VGGTRKPTVEILQGGGCLPYLTYKAELKGITVKITEEAYTSKASLLDLDPLPVGMRAVRSTRLAVSV